MNKDEFVKKHFPEIDPGRVPCGNKVTVQLQVIRQKVGSLYIPSEAQEFNKNATVVCRLVKVGQIAFRDRSSGELWKEGAWAEVGDIVLMPRYGGMNRVEIPIPGEEEETAIFATYNDFDIVDKVTGQFEHYTKIL